MPVIFAAIGGGVIVVAATTYDDYGDHSDYGDYDNYNDAAERKKRRVSALKAEAESAAQELSGYKKATVNPRLSSEALKRKPAMSVSETDMDKDAKSAIRQKMQAQISSETRDAEAQIKEIDKLLARISEIQKEESEK